MIYFTSDFHFCHNKPFLYEPRGFSNIYDMNETIIQNFNKSISWDDDLFILGDLFLNDNENGLKYVRRLPGRLHILRGNHDTDARMEMLLSEPRIYYHGYADIFKYKKYIFYLSHYPTMTANYDDKKKYPLINLYGHTHQKTNFYNNNSFMYHVGLDSHNCYPVSIDQIIEDIKENIERKI